MDHQSLTRRAPRRGWRGADIARLERALIASIALAALAACSGKAVQDSAVGNSDFPYSLQTPLLFELGPGGFKVLDPRPAASPGAASASAEAANPVPEAPGFRRRAVIAARLDSKEVQALASGYGAARLVPSPDGFAYRIDQAPDPAFAGLDAGALWPWDGAYLALGFRDPFRENRAAREPGSPRLFVWKDGAFQVFEAPWLTEASGRGELFALFPISGSTTGPWMAHFRTVNPDGRAESVYFELRDLRGRGSARSRRVFEASLRPRPILEGPAGLRSGLARLGIEAAVLRLRDGGGSDGFWSLGPAEDAVPIEAWTVGASTLILTPSGILAREAPEGGRLYALSGPDPETRFGSLAASLLGDRLLVAAAWESGERGGILVFGLPAGP